MMRLAGFALFPILGSLLAWGFRPPEPEWRTLHPADSPRPDTVRLNLPNGQVLRMIGVPGFEGKTAFYLSETEIPITAVPAEMRPGPFLEQARTLCRHWSLQTGEDIRLPTMAEWRLAARAGVANAEVPWGFTTKAVPAGVHVNLDRPPRQPGPAFGYGFRDMAGGRWEWTKEGMLLGGAWSETNPDSLRIDHHWSPPAGYADADTGFRIRMAVP